MKATPPVELSARHKLLLPALLAVAIFMQMLDVTVLNTALPAIARDLNQSALNMQSVIVSYVLTVALFIPISGYLSDRFGTRRIFILAIGLFVLGSFLCALAMSLNQLVAARVVQGLGGALLTPVARLALMKSFDQAQLMRALNYAVMPALLGPRLGPLVGGYLVEHASWHWIFLMNLPIGLLAMVVGWKVMPNFTDSRTRLDVVGMLLFASSAFLLTLGVEFSGEQWPLAVSLGVIALGLALLWVYKKYATNNPNAIYPLNLLAVRTFRVGLNGNLITRIGIASIPLLLPLLFQVVFGYSAIEAAWLLVSMAVAAMVGKPLLRPLLHAVGYRKVLIWNTLMVGLLIVSLATIQQHTPKAVIVAHLLLLGLANSIQFTAMSTLTLANLRPTQKSSGNSLMAVNQQLAMGLGTALGAMFLRLSHDLPWVADDSYKAFQVTFIIIGLITVSSGWIFSQLHPWDGDAMAQRSH